MPVKNFTTDADPQSLESLQVTIANILHSAGVTMAISPRGAELITRIAMDWFDGQYERAIVEADKAGRELREMRACRRPCVASVPTSTPEVRRRPGTDQSDPAPAAAPSQDAAAGRQPAGREMNCWRIRVSARHESIVSAHELTDAILQVASQLPRHITSVRVTETAPL